MRRLTCSLLLAVLATGCLVEPATDHDVEVRRAALEPGGGDLPEGVLPLDAGDVGAEEEEELRDASFGTEEGNPEPTPWELGTEEGNPEPTPWDPGGDESNPEPTPWEPDHDGRSGNPEPTPWRQDGEPDEDPVESGEDLVATTAPSPWDRW